MSFDRKRKGLCGIIFIVLHLEVHQNEKQFQSSKKCVGFIYC